MDSVSGSDTFTATPEPPDIVRFATLPVLTTPKFWLSVLSKYGVREMELPPVMDRVFEVKDKVCASVLSRYEARETEFPPVMDRVFEVKDKVCASVLSK
jgi:hypothetical protein